MTRCVVLAYLLCPSCDLSIACHVFLWLIVQAVWKKKGWGVLGGGRKYYERNSPLRLHCFLSDARCIFVVAFDSLQ